MCRPSLIFSSYPCFCFKLLLICGYSASSHANKMHCKFYSEAFHAMAIESKEVHFSAMA